jgi:adenylate kinase
VIESRGRLTRSEEMVSTRPVRVAVLGRPGSGKGTQSARLARVLGVPHISTGELLRAEIEQGSRLGRRAQEYVEAGQLVPDVVVQDSLAQRFEDDDVQRDGFVLDGFPRTVDQAVALESLLAPHDLDAVVELMVPEREAAERLGARLVCPECGRSVSRDSRSALCERCGTVLARRTDDDIDVIRARFEVFENETRPLLEWLDQRGRLVAVDGNRPVSEVTRRVISAVQSILDHDRFSAS